jgi:hypothetical protein
VKKLIISLVLLAACRSSAPSTTPTPEPASTISGNMTGGADALSAVRGFMSAVKSQDLQAIGAFWGDNRGPARNLWPRDELEKRELVMVCYLKHDRYDIAGDAPRAGGHVFVVNVMFKDLSRSTSMTVVRGPSNRWYVQEVDIRTLQDICSRRS